MTFETLKWYRFLAPLVITSGCVLPFVLASASLEDAEKINTLVVPLIAGIIAFLYAGLDLRRWHWRAEIHGSIEPQIRGTLLSMLPPDLNVSDEERNTLARHDIFRPLTGVFWEAVNRDPQLKDLKPHFFANGFLYTTAIDVYILCGVSGIAYGLAHFVLQQPAFLYIAAASICLALMSRLLIVPTRRARHIELSRQQLDLLQRNQRAFVEDRFRDIVLARRRDGIL